MIRWSYLVPRLLIVVVLLSAYWFGLNPLARWALVHTGQRLTSAEVDLASAQLSLRRGQLVLSGLEVVDPRHPLKNLLAADDLELDLDTAALLRRKLIVEQARATGLRFDTDRENAGALKPRGRLHLSLPGKELLSASGRRLAELGRQWLDQMAAGLQQNLAEEMEQLESMRAVRSLAQRWPRQLQDLESRADGLRARLEQIRNSFAHRPASPLEGLQFVQHLTTELEAIQGEVAELQRLCGQLPQQVARDRDEVAAAARRDRDELRRRLRIVDVRPEQLSEYLWERELSQRVATVLQWIRWASRLGTEADDEPEPVRARGVDVLPANPSEPDFLVRWLSVDGRVWYDGRAYDFLATVAGLTGQPKVLRQPTVIRARVKLPAEMWVEAALDRSGAEPQDRITVQCLALPQPSRTLGNPDQLALAISPGTTSFRLEVELCGPRLSGRLQVRQEPVELSPLVGPRCGGTRVAGLLQSALSPLRRLEAEVLLCGTAAEPQWRLESNLGRELAAGLSTALARELDARRDQLLAEIDRRLNEQLARAQQLLAGQQEQLNGKLQSVIAEARQAGNALAQRLPVTMPNLSGVLPAGLPLRF